MMKNMDPKSSEWLASVGIHTLDDVAKLDLTWNELPPDVKNALRKRAEEG